MQILPNRTLPFYGMLVVLSLTLLFLIYGLFLMTQCVPELYQILLLQFVNTWLCYATIGIGLGLPLILLASIFGWLQLVLLINGTISPHLGRAGFFKVLGTLFTKI